MEITRHNVHNAGLYWHMQSYPRTGIARYWINSYNLHKEFEGKEPTTINLHYIWQVYGGPEEGGWWYQAGTPVEKDGTNCVFGKKNCIQRCIELTEKYRLHLQPRIDTSQGFESIDATLSNHFAEEYPRERPYYH